MRSLTIILCAALCACALAAPRELLLDPLTSTDHWEPAGIRVNYSLGDTSLAAAKDAPPGAAGSVALTYDFRINWRRWVGAHWLGGPLLGTPRELRLWVLGNACGHDLVVRIRDLTGGVYEKPIAPIDWTGWREVTTDLTAGWRQILRTADKAHSPALPLTLDSLSLVQHRTTTAPEGVVQQGTINFALLRVTADVAAVDEVRLQVKAAQARGLFYVPDVPTWQLQLDNSTAEAVAGDLTLDITDFFGQTRQVWQKSISLAAHAKTTVTMTAPEKRLGAYTGVVTLRSPDRAQRLAVTFAISSPAAPTPLDEQSPFGINFLSASFPSGPERELALKLGAEAGIKWERVGFGMAQMEPRRDQFAWQGPASVPGAVGKALDFGGGCAQYVVPHTAPLARPAQRGELSLSFWIKLNSLQMSGEWHNVLSKDLGPPPTREFQVYFCNSRRYFALSSGDQATKWSDAPCDKTDWQVGRWYHLAATHKASGTTRWFVDGTPEGEAEPRCATLHSTTAPLRLGPGPSDFSFTLDDLQIYDRILTPAEVAALTQHQPLASAPVAWYACDEAAETLADKQNASPGRLADVGIDDLIADDARYGISVYGLLGFPPRWASTAPPDAERYAQYAPDSAAFEAYCRAVAEHYRDRVRYWEIWNEPNITVFWEPEPNAAAYAETLAAGYRGCKAGNPDCRVMGISLAGSNRPLTWVEQVFAAGGGANMDLVSLHPYRQPATPEATDLVADMRDAWDIGERHGGGRRLWLTEIGWPNEFGGGGSSEELTALMVPRSHIEALASGVVDHISWFRFHDCGDDTGYMEHWCGLVRQNLQPKAAYFAYRTMARSLAGQKFTKRLEASGVLRAYLFSGSGRQTVALWQPDTPLTVAVKVGPSARALDLMGNPRGRRLDKDWLLVQATPAATFIAGVGGQPLVKPLLLADPASLELGRGEQRTVTLHLTNPLSTPVRVRVALTHPDALDSTALPEQSLAAGGTVTLKTDLAASADAAPGLRVLRLSLDGPLKDVALDLPVAVTAARRDAPPVARYTFDGDLTASTAADSSGNGFTARLLDGARITPSGRHGQGLELPTVTARAQVDDAPLLSLPDEFTLLAWVKPAGENKSWQWVMAKCEGDRQRNYGLYLSLRDGAFYFTGTPAPMGTGHTDLPSGRQLWDGQWHHVAATYSRWSGKLRLYVDGAQAQEHDFAPDGLAVTTAPLMIGEALGGGADGHTSAYLDDVAIYPRALIAAEVAVAAK